LTDQTNYYRSTGASISPQWSATDKISMSFSVSREDQSYIGTSPIALNQSARKDTVNAQLATLSYIPTRALSFNLSYRREQRSSNQPLRTYTDGLTSANVKFAF
jgi:hemolysin activation/secretion protein